MNTKPVLVLPLLAAALLGAARQPADDLSFHVKSGTSLTRSFESRQEISLDDAEILLNGQPFPSGKRGGMTAIQGKALEIGDEFVEVENGAPRKLRRTFDKIESTGEQTTENPMDSGDQTDTWHAKSELAGKTVVFDWEEAKSQFKKSFDPEGPDSKLADGLVEDLDFRSLLPAKGKASEDESWKIDVSAIQALFLPGGDLVLRPVEAPEGEDEDDEPVGLLSESPTEAFKGLTGEVEATYKGTREVDGVSCGVIALEFKVSATRELPGRQPKAKGKDSELQVERLKAFLSLEGEGELIWDLSGGYARSFNASAKIKNQLEIPMKVANGDKTMDITRKMQMSGSYELKVAVAKR
ncbi:MAG TPA: hypothetical protein VK843_17285 [Planctomycetota bacterium]|nr:hypothetical protein [Planctomycetota bacterium]